MAAALEQEGDPEQRGDRQMQQHAIGHDQPDVAAGQRAALNRQRQREDVKGRNSTIEVTRPGL
jgi:hypothetical protein